MKIGLLIYGSLETVSGGYLYDRKLVAHLRAHGDTVEIVSLPWSSYGRHLTHNFRRDLRQRLQNGAFDLLLQDELNHPSLFWLNGRLRPLLPCPLISIVHHLRSSESHPRGLLPLYRQIERRYLRSVDGFIFNSQTTRQTVDEMIEKNTRPFIVATPAGDRFQPKINAATLTAKCKAPGALRLLFVGSITPRKGLHLLIEALAALPKTSWQLDVVGDTAVDPAYVNRIQRQIAQSRLTESIALHGTISDSTLERYYRRAHLLAVPSRYEGFGIVYLEGMRFGLPAIGTTAGAAGEIIKDKENGVLIDWGETAVLTQRIQQLADNRDDLLHLSLNARRHALTWPTWDQSMAAIRLFLQEEIMCLRAVNE